MHSLQHSADDDVEVGWPVMSLLALLLAVRILAMIWVPLTDPTEARYAEIARKMVETGNWITPQFDYGVPFWAKPPLQVWLSAAGMAALGPTPFAARLGIFLSSLATLAILYLWGRTIADRGVAVLAVIVAASSCLFFVGLGFVQTDMILTLGVTACMAGFFNAMAGYRSWGWLFFLGLAIGLLAKGPIAGVLSIGPIVLWMTWRGRWGHIGRLPWAGGMALCAALVVPWYATAEIATPGYLKYFLIGEHIQRYLQAGWSGDLYGAGRAHWRGSIALFWLAATLPWGLFLPRLARRLFKQRLQDRNGVYSYLLLFAFMPIAFFIPAANIVLAYVLPGMPAAALLGVMLWSSSDLVDTRWLHWGLVSVLLPSVAITAASVVRVDHYILPSEASLVGSFSGTGQLAILDSRSFSAEFYTLGKVIRLRSLDDLAAWLRLGDGVLVPEHENDAFVSRFGNSVTRAAQDRRYTLFVSTGG